MLMKLSDFGNPIDGYNAWMDLDDETEFCLASCFREGTQGVLKAMKNIVHQLKTIPTITIRYSMLLKGIEMEDKHGIQLTGKAPASSAIVKKEFGIKNVSKKKTGIAFQMLLSLSTLMMLEVVE